MTNVVKFPRRKGGGYEDEPGYTPEVTRYFRELLTHFIANKSKPAEQIPENVVLEEAFDAYAAFVKTQGYTGEFFDTLDRAFTDYVIRLLKLSDTSMTGLTRGTTAVYCIYDEECGRRFPWPKWMLHTTFNGVGSYTYTDEQIERSDVVYCEWIYTLNGTPGKDPTVHDAEGEYPGVLRCSAVQPWAYYAPVHINNTIALHLCHTERDAAVLWYQMVPAIEGELYDGVRMGWRSVETPAGLIDLSIAKESFLVFPTERFLFSPCDHPGWKAMGVDVPASPIELTFPPVEATERVRIGLELEIAKYK